MADKKNLFVTPLEDLTIMAEGGDPVKQLVLSFRFAESLGAAIDLGKSLNWRRKSLKKKNQAAVIFHMIYNNTEMAAMRKKLAENFVKKHLEVPEKVIEVAIVLYALGVLYLEEREPSKAFKVLEESSSLGNPAARTDLALLYLEGKGVEKDEKRGVELLKSALELGHYNAAVHLHRAYIEGLGVQKDSMKAAEVLKKGVERGSSQAFMLYAQQQLKANASPSTVDKLVEEATDRNHLCPLTKFAAYLAQSDLQEKMAKFHKICEIFDERRYAFGLYYTLHIYKDMKKANKRDLSIDKVPFFLEAIAFSLLKSEVKKKRL